MSFSSLKSSKNIFVGLYSTFGQKRLRGGPQHAAVVDFPAGGSKSLRINQESPTWARKLWSNEITRGRCARHHHSPLTSCAPTAIIQMDFSKSALEYSRNIALFVNLIMTIFWKRGKESIFSEYFFTDCFWNNFYALKFSKLNLLIPPAGIY